MNSSMVDIGIGGIFVLLVLRLIFDFLKEYRNRKNGISANGNLGFGSSAYVLKVEKAMKQLDEMHGWHAPDAKGMQEWKNPLFKDSMDFLGEVLNKLSANLDKQSDIQQSIYNQLKENKSTLDIIHSKVSN